ncbi:MAG: hypothetical protein WC438_00225 [Candidatus Pacearchaeota archaeon]
MNKKEKTFLGKTSFIKEYLFLKKGNPKSTFLFENKKGQFYLVAAILIVMILFGIFSVRSYAVVNSEPRKVQDISSELKEETARIVDYGIYSASNITQLYENFTDKDYSEYFLKKTEQTNVVFIYGNKTNLYSIQYLPTETGTVSATLGGASTVWNEETTYINKTKIIPIAGSTVLTVNLFDKEFKFDLRENQMFYFIVAQQQEGEIYAERN